MKLTGIADIGLGSWELFKAKKAFKELKITEENYTSKKRLNLTKIGLGGIKMCMLGVATYEVALPILQSNNINSYELGILATFAAGYAVLATSTLYAGVLNDEAFNYKHIQGNLLKKADIVSQDLNSYELHANDSYKLYMFGNKLKTGNPFDEFIFKVSAKSQEWISKFNLKEDKDFNFIRNKILNILEKVGISNLINKMSNTAKQKSKLYNTIKEHTDINHISNFEFKKYLEINHKDLLEDTDLIKKLIAETNQKAIIRAQTTIIEQNIQIFFTQLILDYNKGIKNDSLIELFKNLNDSTSLKNKESYSESYNSISLIARKMANNEDLSEYNTAKKILVKINNNLIDKNNNLKILTFDSAFKLYKKEEVNKLNGTNKSNLNIYLDKKAIFTEIDLNSNSFENIVKIKSNKEIKNIKQKIE